VTGVQPCALPISPEQFGTGPPLATACGAYVDPYPHQAFDRRRFEAAFPLPPASARLHPPTAGDQRRPVEQRRLHRLVARHHVRQPLFLQDREGAGVLSRELQHGQHQQSKHRKRDQQFQQREPRTAVHSTWTSPSGSTSTRIRARSPVSTSEPLPPAPPWRSNTKE